MNALGSPITSRQSTFVRFSNNSNAKLATFKLPALPGGPVAGVHDGATTGGPAGDFMVSINVLNMGDEAGYVRIQESTTVAQPAFDPFDVSENSGAFSASFSDIAGKTATVVAGGMYEFQLNVAKTRKYLRVNGSGSYFKVTVASNVELSLM